MHCINYVITRKLIVSAVVVRVTCDLLFQAIPSDDRWNHISGLQLADPDFGRLGRVDLLLVVEVFTEVVLHGRRSGPPGLPIAFDTQFSCECKLLYSCPTMGMEHNFTELSSWV